MERCRVHCHVQSEMVGKAAKPKRKLGASRLNPMAAAAGEAVGVPTAAEEKQLEAEAEEQSGRILSERRSVAPDVRARAAHLVASRFDAADVHGAVGTVAGDDTLLIVADEDIGAPAVVAAIKGARA